MRRLDRSAVHIAALLTLLALSALVVFGFSGKGEKQADKVNVQDRYRARFANLTRSY